jgi:hypothetical protein
LSSGDPKLKKRLFLNVTGKFFISNFFFSEKIYPFFSENDSFSLAIFSCNIKGKWFHYANHPFPIISLFFKFYQLLNYFSLQFFFLLFCFLGVAHPTRTCIKVILAKHQTSQDSSVVRFLLLDITARRKKSGDSLVANPSTTTRQPLTHELTSKTKN